MMGVAMASRLSRRLRVLLGNQLDRVSWRMRQKAIEALCLETPRPRNRNHRSTHHYDDLPLGPPSNSQRKIPAAASNSFPSLKGIVTDGPIRLALCERRNSLHCAKVHAVLRNQRSKTRGAYRAHVRVGVFVNSESGSRVLQQSTQFPLYSDSSTLLDEFS